MRIKRLILMFVIAGLLFAGTAIYFSLIPTTIYHTNNYEVSQWEENKHPPSSGQDYTENGNTGLGSIAMGIISASCFLVSGYLIKKNSDVDKYVS